MERPTVEGHFPEFAAFWRRFIHAIEAFFFAPASARPLGALRIGLAAVLMAQAWLLRAEMLDYFSSDGIIQWSLADSVGSSLAPRMSWFVEKMGGLGISEISSIEIVCGMYFTSLVLLGAGLFTRVAAVVAWLFQWILMNNAHMMHYGFDHYAHIFLFYLVWIPAGSAFSLDVALGRTSTVPTSAARLGLRVMQIHLCLSYLVSGIEKSAGIQWWNGELLWRVTSLPIYRQFDMSWLADWPIVSQLGGLAALGIEIGYFILIWPMRTRKLWIAATLALHLGIAVLLGLHLFGAIMCVLTLTLFGFSSDVGRR